MSICESERECAKNKREMDILRADLIFARGALARARLAKSL
jgi:hypothetical protein